MLMMSYTNSLAVPCQQLKERWVNWKEATEECPLTSQDLKVGQYQVYVTRIWYLLPLLGFLNYCASSFCNLSGSYSQPLYNSYSLPRDGSIPSLWRKIQNHLFPCPEDLLGQDKILSSLTCIQIVHAHCTYWLCTQIMIQFGFKNASRYGSRHGYFIFKDIEFAKQAKVARMEAV